MKDNSKRKERNVEKFRKIQLKFQKSVGRPFVAFSCCACAVTGSGIVVLLR
jgi:hypothetical protein